MKSLQGSFSSDDGFQCKGLHQPHKRAKEDAATEEPEERGKHCWHVAFTELVKSGWHNKTKSLGCDRRSCGIFPIGFTSSLRPLCTSLESCKSLRYNYIYTYRKPVYSATALHRGLRTRSNETTLTAKLGDPGFIWKVQETSWDLLCLRWKAEM